MGHDLAVGWLAAPGRHLHRVGDEFGAEVICDGPADHASGPRVDDDREIDLAVQRGVFGDVHDPKPVRAIRVEGPVHQVVVDVTVTGPGAAPVSFGVVDPDRSADPHEPFTRRLRTMNTMTEAEFVADPR